MRNLKTIKAGIDRRIRKAKSLPPKKYDQFTDVQTYFFNRNDPLVILDVGAHQPSLSFNLIYVREGLL